MEEMVGLEAGTVEAKHEVQSEARFRRFIIFVQDWSQFTIISVWFSLCNLEEARPWKAWLICPPGQTVILSESRV